MRIYGIVGIREQLDDWETYMANTWDKYSETMREVLMDRRVRLLKILLKLQLRGFDNER